MAEDHDINGSGNGNGKISYTIRELLNELKVLVNAIDQKLDNKAERSVVDGLEKRVVTIEVQRTAEGAWGNQLISEFRDLQKAHGEMKIAMNSLETSKKDKEAFNLMWVPIAVGFLLDLALLYLAFKH